MKITAFLAAVMLLAAPLTAQVPNLVPHQGRVAVNGVNFDGAGQFKFALVNAAGTVTYWSNNGSSTAGSQPTAAVSLPVTKGLYSVMLGDTSLANMIAVPASVYANADLRLRVWFNNGTLGFQQLTPDQRLAPNGYLPDGAVTTAKLAPGATAPAVVVTGAAQTMAVNTAYTATGSGPTTFTVPGSATAGDTVQITGTGAGPIQILDPYSTKVWTARLSPGGWQSVASSADGMKLIAAGLGGQIFISTDSGVTWTPRETNRGWRGVASSADGNKLVAVVNSGHIYTSTDAGLNWAPRESVRDWRCVASSADGTRLVAAVDGGLIYTSSDSGANWTPHLSSLTWTGIALSADGTKILASAYNNYLYTSPDFGGSWNSLGLQGRWISVASSADGNRLVAAAYQDRVYTSTDAGLNWTPRESVRDWWCVASSADGTRLVAGVWTERLHISVDSGVTWVPTGPAGAWSALASSAGGERLLAAAETGYLYTNGGIIHTADGSSNTTVVATATGWNVVESYGGWVSGDGNLVRPAGNIGIGIANPATALHVNGVITGDGSGLTNLPSANLSGTIPDALLSGDVARRTGGNAFTGTQSITVGSVGIGTTSPAALLQLGDKNVSNSVGMMRFASTSPSRSAWREWEIGVPGGTEDVTGRNYSFIIDDLLAGGGQPEVLVRYDTGHVGIGTANPVARLDVDTGGAGRVQIRNEGNFVPGLNITGGPLPGYLRFRNAFEIWPNDAGTAPGRMDIRNTTGAPTITMDGGTGRIGIGRTAAVNRLEVEGDASKAIAGAWLSNSDRRIKTGITPVTGALATLEKVRPVTFRYTEEYRKAHPDIADVPYYNVIAQEFREVFPDAVKSSGEKLPDGSEILQVDTYPATITALAAIKELKAENDALKAANQAMEQRLAALEEMMRRTQPVKINSDHQ